MNTASKSRVQPLSLESTLVTHYRNNIRSIRNLRSLTSPEIFERKIATKEVQGGGTPTSSLYKFVVSQEIPISRTEVIESLGVEREVGNAPSISSSSNPQIESIPGIGSITIAGVISKTYRLRYIYKGWTPGILVDNTQQQAIADIHITLRSSTEIGVSAVPKLSQAVSIELELPREYPEATIRALVLRIMDIHNGWAVPNIVSTVTNMRNMLESTGLKHPRQLQRPFDISWADLTYDNLIAKPHAISFKADGIRFLLCISPVGIFLCTSSLDIIPLYVPSIGSKAISEVILIDGELVGNGYWTFDLLFHNGVNYMPLPLTERYGELGREYSMRLKNGIDTSISLPVVPIPQGIEGKTINIYLKPIIIPRTPQEFFSAVEKMSQYPREHGVKSDGEIFTEVSKPYSNNVYKWKPPLLLTVDFFIGPISTTGMGSTLTSSNKDVTLGTFQDGSILYHPELKAISSGIDLSDLIGTIGEFEVVREDLQDETSKPTNVWKYVRQRVDKATPNSEKVYIAITRLLRDPITLPAITGKSLQLMRKYHNRVKRLVYDFLGRSGVGTITDIGSGKGGDLSSWIENQMQVNAIEPDPNNVKDLISRAKSSYEVDIQEYTIPDTSATQSGNITEISISGECWGAIVYPVKAEKYVDLIDKYSISKTDGLTLFNSLTFLGPSTLSCLISESIYDTGYIVILVIDGKVLSNIFLNTGYKPKLIEINRVQCPPISQNTTITTMQGTTSRGIGVGTETFGNLGCIYIRLTDSATVSEGQVEGLVDVDVVLNTLKQSGWIPETDMYLTGEKLMGEEEAAYSSAQRLLILKHVSISGYAVRYIYKPLPSGDSEIIQDTPWGTVVRVGTPIEAVSQYLYSGSNTNPSDISFVHAILQATDPEYRKKDNIGKSMYALIKSKPGVKLIPQNTPVYMIPENSWDMYVQIHPATNQDTGLNIYPAIGGARMNRPPGIVLIVNDHHWEPLAKPTLNNNLIYIW